MPARVLCIVATVLGTTVGVWGAKDGHHAQPIAGLSGLDHPITTSSADAQAFFNQGLEMVYGFNHAAAADAFREAIELDSECAMCFWGVALALGPNINASMAAADNEEAWNAVQNQDDSIYRMVVAWCVWYQDDSIYSMVVAWCGSIYTMVVWWW